jgi:hypothetical protein
MEVAREVHVRNAIVAVLPGLAYVTPSDALSSADVDVSLIGPAVEKTVVRVWVQCFVLCV